MIQSVSQNGLYTVQTFIFIFNLYIAINANIIAKVSCDLGSGRTTKDDVIDTSVGVFLNKQVGDSVEEGDTLCTLYYNKVKDSFNILDAYTIE